MDDLVRCESAGRHQDCVESCSAAFVMAPSAAAAGLASKLLTVRARAQAELSLLQEALEDAQAALELDAGRPECLLLIAEALPDSTRSTSSIYHVGG